MVTLEVRGLFTQALSRPVISEARPNRHADGPSPRSLLGRVGFPVVTGRGGDLRVFAQPRTGRRTINGRVALIWAVPGLVLRLPRGLVDAAAVSWRPLFRQVRARSRRQPSWAAKASPPDLINVADRESRRRDGRRDRARHGRPRPGRVNAGIVAPAPSLSRTPRHSACLPTSTTWPSSWSQAPGPGSCCQLDRPSG